MTTVSLNGSSAYAMHHESGASTTCASPTKSTSFPFQSTTTTQLQQSFNKNSIELLVHKEQLEHIIDQVRDQMAGLERSVERALVQDEETWSKLLLVRDKAPFCQYMPRFEKTGSERMSREKRHCLDNYDERLDSAAVEYQLVSEYVKALVERTTDEVEQHRNIQAEFKDRLHWVVGQIERYEDMASRLSVSYSYGTTVPPSTISSEEAWRFGEPQAPKGDVELLKARSKIDSASYQTQWRWKDLDQDLIRRLRPNDSGGL